LYCPVVIPLPESYPIAVLLNPVVTSRKAWVPTAVLLLADVWVNNVSYPTATL
jgi:hypothetical protein